MRKGTNLAGGSTSRSAIKGAWRTSVLRPTSSEPVTPRRPDDFRGVGAKNSGQKVASRNRAKILNPDDPEKEHTIRWQSEILFLSLQRNSSSRENCEHKLHPDLCSACISMPKAGVIRKSDSDGNNHLHLLVNGSYLKDELEYDDERFEMLRRLLSRAYDEELPLADAVAENTGQGRTVSRPTSIQPERMLRRWERQVMFTPAICWPHGLSLSGGLLRTICDE